MSQRTEYLDLDDLIELAQRLLGAPPPLRDPGLLAAAVARPQTTVGGEDAYRTIWLKAAALLQSLVNNHALVDGNKRSGWLATAVFLEINDASVAKVDNDTVYELVVDVAASDLGIDEIASRLEQMAERSPESSAGDYVVVAMTGREDR